MNQNDEEVEEAGEAIDKRFSVYGPIFEKSEDTLNAIRIAFSQFCQVEGNSVLVRIGSVLFNVRGRMLTQFAKEHPVSS